jgi:2-dehydro-3-deoxy-D-arabinonate dehydratase
MVSNELVGLRLLRVRSADGRTHVGLLAGDELSILATDDMLAVLESDAPVAEVVHVTIADPETCAPPDPWTLLVPLVAPETWAAGVTYERSRDARLRESEVADVYDLVYEAQRPELFFKDAAGRRTVGPGEPIAVRSDSSWTVPEPELAVVIGGGGDMLAATIANDVSARDIEGANPLYLPQAKIYGGACALGPSLLVPVDWAVPFEVELRITAGTGETVFSGRASTDSMRRPIEELIWNLRRHNPVPAGSVLLTGTGIVPPDHVTLAAGQVVTIRIEGIGELRNPVRLAD